MSLRIPRRFAIVTATGLLIAGCSGGDPDAKRAVPVSGTVTYKGEPISAGRIVFQPDKGRPAEGEITDGAFSLSTYKPGDGAVEGHHKVGVVAVEEVPATKAGKAGNESTTKFLVPAKYNDPGLSGLEATVPSGGSKEIKITLD